MLSDQGKDRFGDVCYGSDIDVAAIFLWFGDRFGNCLHVFICFVIVVIVD